MSFCRIKCAWLPPILQNFNNMAVELFNNGTHACLAFYDLRDEEADHAVQCNQFSLSTVSMAPLIDPAAT